MSDLPVDVGRFGLGAACIVFDAAGDVLLVRQTYGRRLWSLPGGIAEHGEAPEAAARRELHEETGLTAATATLSGVYFQADHPLGPFLHVAFRMEVAPDQAPRPDHDEIDEVRFCAVGSLPRPHSRLTAVRVADALAGNVNLTVMGPSEIIEGA